MLGQGVQLRWSHSAGSLGVIVAILGVGGLGRLELVFAHTFHSKVRVR
jgi:hypothetical protein